MLELARLVHDPIADRLELRPRGTKVLALEIYEREVIIRALEDPPAGLEELRGVLLREVEWVAARRALNTARRMMHVVSAVR